MRALIWGLLLGLAGCSSVEPCAVEDAGEQLELDGGPLESDAGADAGEPVFTLTGEQACLFLRDSIDEHGNTCQPCPFLGSTACDSSKLVACLYLLELQGGDCVSDASILRSADCTGACQ